MRPRLPRYAGRRDRASSVAQKALLFALPASFSRSRRSYPGSATSFFSSLPALMASLFSRGRASSPIEASVTPHVISAAE